MTGADYQIISHTGLWRLLHRESKFREGSNAVIRTLLPRSQICVCSAPPSGHAGDLRHGSWVPRAGMKSMRSARPKPVSCASD